MAETGTEARLRWLEIPIELPESGRSETFELDGIPLLLCNADGRPFVVRDECPHVQTSMQGGTIQGTILECPLHGGQLDLRDGTPVAMPIRRPATCYPVRERSEGAGLEIGLPARAVEGPDRRRPATGPVMQGRRHRAFESGPEKAEDAREERK